MATRPVAPDHDDHDNNLVAAGALLAILLMTQTNQVTSIEALVDANGFATNQIDLGFSFLKSAYRITIERVPD
jgi:hypothetical protein